jgi:hypothetical protein
LIALLGSTIPHLMSYVQVAVSSLDTMTLPEETLTDAMRFTASGERDGEMKG